MNDTIKMAREAGLGPTTVNVWLAYLERFAALVRADEQDRCCKIVCGMAGSDNVAQRTVDAIRSNHV